MKNCMYCNKKITEDFYNKCDECFVTGQTEGVRQTGRTCRLLKQCAAIPGAVYVMPFYQMRRSLEFLYPHMEGQIVTTEALPNRLKGTKGIHVFFDHTVREFPDPTRSIRECFRVMKITNAQLHE